MQEYKIEFEYKSRNSSGKDWSFEVIEARSAQAAVDCLREYYSNVPQLEITGVYRILTTWR